MTPLKELIQEEYKKVCKVVVSQLNALKEQHAVLENDTVGNEVVTIEYNVSEKNFTLKDTIKGDDKTFAGPSFEATFGIWQKIRTREEEKRTSEMNSLSREIKKLEEFLDNIELFLTIEIGFSVDKQDPIINYNFVKKFAFVQDMLTE